MIKQERYRCIQLQLFSAEQLSPGATTNEIILQRDAGLTFVLKSLYEDEDRLALIVS